MPGVGWGDASWRTHRAHAFELACLWSIALSSAAPGCAVPLPQGSADDSLLNRSRGVADAAAADDDEAAGTGGGRDGGQAGAHDGSRDPTSTSSIRDAGGWGDAGRISDDVTHGFVADPTCAGRDAVAIVELVNRDRALVGLGPLRCENALSRAALGHSEDMCAQGFFDHRSPSGSTPYRRVAATGFKADRVAENIARGPVSPQEAHADWMSSPGHRANVLASYFANIGVARSLCGSAFYWTEVFSD